MIDLIKKNKVKSLLVLLLIFIDIFVVSISLISSKHDITAPGGINSVESLIEVDGNFHIDGSFNTIYVYSYERASILQTYIASFAEYNLINPSSDSIVLNREEQLLAGKIQKNQSIEASLICAYNAAGKKLDYKFIGLIVRSKQINHEPFKIGDLIVSIVKNGITYGVDDIVEFEKAINKLETGDIINYYRDDKLLSYTCDALFNYDDKNMFYVYEKYEVNSENSIPSYKLHKSNTLGPSGGLLQTLSIYCQITGIDLTKGKVVCGTGTISVNGKIGAIGGIKQKIVTAINSGADIFICPSVHEKEAKEMYYKTKGHENMKLLIVTSFMDAVSQLRELK